MKDVKKSTIIGEIRQINIEDKESIINKNSKMADKALRVLAVAYRDVDRLPSNIDTENIEKSLIFVRITWNDRSTERGCKRSNKNL